MRTLWDAISVHNVQQHTIRYLDASAASLLWTSMHNLLPVSCSSRAVLSSSITQLLEHLVETNEGFEASDLKFKRAALGKVFLISASSFLYSPLFEFLVPILLIICRHMFMNYSLRFCELLPIVFRLSIDSRFSHSMRSLDR